MKKELDTRRPEACMWGAFDKVVPGKTIPQAVKNIRFVMRLREKGGWSNVQLYLCCWNV